MSADLLYVAPLAEELAQFLTQFEQQIERNTPLVRTERSDDLSVELLAQLSSHLDGLLLQLSQTEISGEENRLASSVLWNRCRAWLETGWLQTQARLKPRGYAGDFELLSRIWNRKLSPLPLGRYFDAYFLAQGAPVAVCNRMQMVADWLVEKVSAPLTPAQEQPFKVVSVGCGPGLDVLTGLQRLLPNQQQQVQVTLLDIDPQAIAFAEQQFSAAPLACRLPPQFLQANLFRLPKKPAFSAPLEGASLLVCTGLYDYLDDAAATQMLAIFWERLAPGGTLVVFHFAPCNPTRAYMEWFGNWYLIYRTREELGRIAEAAGIPAQHLTLGAEPLGINVFISAVKPYSQ